MDFPKGLWGCRSRIDVLQSHRHRTRVGGETSGALRWDRRRESLGSESAACGRQWHRPSPPAEACAPASSGCNEQCRVFHNNRLPWGHRLHQHTELSHVSVHRALMKIFFKRLSTTFTEILRFPKAAGKTPIIGNKSNIGFGN